jgi:ribosome maturation factor RimP
VRLIEVSEIQREGGPIGERILLDESPGLLKPLNPAEQFRRHAHFRLENLNEPTLA